VDPGPPDEASLRRLFDLCDRDGDGLIKKRELLIQLKRHSSIRPLFGLPATSTEAGGSLNPRLQEILNAFETDGGLGELQPEFEEVSRGSLIVTAAAGETAPNDEPDGPECNGTKEGETTEGNCSSPPVKVDHIKWENFLAHFSSDRSKHRAHHCISLLPNMEDMTPKTFAVFVPTSEWREVPPGWACPAGLEFKMDVDTGKNYARLC
jgi:hypothetical protein